MLKSADKTIIIKDNNKNNDKDDAVILNATHLYNQFPNPTKAKSIPLRFVDILRSQTGTGVPKTLGTQNPFSLLFKKSPDEGAIDNFASESR